MTLTLTCGHWVGCFSSVPQFFPLQNRAVIKSSVHKIIFLYIFSLIKLNSRQFCLSLAMSNTVDWSQKQLTHAGPSQCKDEVFFFFLFKVVSES